MDILVTVIMNLVEGCRPQYIVKLVQKCLKVCMC